MRLLGIDYGLKRIGLALGDSETGIATPLETVDEKTAIVHIQNLIREEGIDECVIGLPYNADGTESEQLLLTKKFIQQLESFVKVNTIDERFTTAEAREMQSEGDIADKDALAALIILETYFSEHS